MIYSSEVQRMCPVAKGAYHGPAPIPEEGKWVTFLWRAAGSPAPETDFADNAA